MLHPPLLWFIASISILATGIITLGLRMVRASNVYLFRFFFLFSLANVCVLLFEDQTFFMSAEAGSHLYLIYIPLQIAAIALSVVLAIYFFKKAFF